MQIPLQITFRGMEPSAAVEVAVRDAFDAARRQLEDHGRRQRGQVKAHTPRTHGHIAELQPDHGRIETADGRLLYFHRNSLLGIDYAKLKVGDEVRYVEEAGKQGPQASSVLAVG